MNRISRTLGAETIVVLAGASAICMLLYLFTLHRLGEVMFTYLPANLLLAWIPFGIALWLRRMLRNHLWSSWPALILSGLWLLFLPNSFYIVTDLVHLQGVYSDDIVTVSVMFISFILTGLLLGYASVYVLHKLLRMRLSSLQTYGILALVFVGCSMAIYIGRDLRWNSWDVLVSPAGLLFDLSERLVTPGEYGSIFAVAGTFFLLLCGFYVVLLRLVHALSRAAKP